MFKFQTCYRKYTVPISIYACSIQNLHKWKRRAQTQGVDIIIPIKSSNFT